jgi:hypothetical protein
LKLEENADLLILGGVEFRVSIYSVADLNSPQLTPPSYNTVIFYINYKDYIIYKKIMNVSRDEERRV